DAIKQQQELTDAHGAEADCRLSELLSRIDAIKQQQELTDAHGVEADLRLGELLSRIDAIKQQTESISNNPFLRIGGLMARLFIWRKQSNE
ncbi:MAG: hypothetical protein M0Q44_05545, partial [Methylobacter sp.]|nr:hypothetical protein [Methylobacter sp.]